MNDMKGEGFPAVGDWCFWEYRLALVKARRDDWFTLGTGVIETSGVMADRCFPLDYRILQISQHFESSEEMLRRDTERMNLNWPDIHRWFVGKWMDACYNKADDDYLKRVFDETQGFCRQIRDGYRDLQFKEVSGIRPFVRA